MIKHYIIEGNNLIGKIPKLWEVQKKDKQSTRERLAFLLERYFHGRKIKVTLHFDGHPNQAIKTGNIKIEYSRNAIAYLNIKQEILLKVEEEVAGISVTPAIPMAKRAGWIGERQDGYLGLVDVDEAPQDMRDIVLKANEDRRGQYVLIAEKHKTKLDLIETVAGKRFVEKSGPGEFVQDEDGKWVKK